MSDEMAMAAHAKMLDAEAERDELRDRLSRVEGAMVEAVLPLEVIAGQHRVKPYRELSPELIEQVNASIEAVRAALPHPEDTGR